MSMLSIDWSSLSMPQHKAVFGVLRDLHKTVIDQVKVKDGHDNTALFAIAGDINREMHAANDDLAQRDHRMNVRNCDCGVCPEVTG